MNVTKWQHFRLFQKQRYCIQGSGRFQAGGNSGYVDTDSDGTFDLWLIHSDRNDIEKRKIYRLEGISWCACPPCPCPPDVLGPENGKSEGQIDEKRELEFIEKKPQD